MRLGSVSVCFAAFAFVAAGAAAGADLVPGFSDGRFKIGIWCVSKNTTDEHVRDIKDCGIDFVLHMRDTARTRPLLTPHGVGEVVLGRNYASLLRGRTPQEELLAMADADGRAVRDACDAGKIPGFLSLEIGDEPSAVRFRDFGEIVTRIEKASGGLPLFLNLYPNYATVAENTDAQAKSQLGASSYREYIDAYCRHVPLDYICWDFYMYGKPGNILPKYYDNFHVVAEACRRTGRKMYFVGQVNSRSPNFWVSERMIRFQAFSALAFGAESLMWGCWSDGWTRWTNDVVDRNGIKTQQYDKLKKVNLEIKAIAPTYMRYRNIATSFIGFSDSCEDLDGVPVKKMEALNDAFIRGLAAADGGRLVIGTMVPRTAMDGGMRAYLVLAADDPFDRKPKSRVVKFAVSEGFMVKAIDGNGPVKIERGEDGLLSFPMESCGGVLLVCRPVSDDGH